MDMSSLKNLFESLIQTLFPKNCAGCNQSFRGQEEILCLSCITHLPISNTWFQKENIVYQKLYGRFPFENACCFLFFTQSGISQKLIHLLKYKSRKDIAFYLGHLFGEHLKESSWIKNIDYIIPVPIHKQKRNLRGFNQSQLLAKGLSESLQIPILKDVLIKHKHTSSQTRKTHQERIENVKNVFEVQNKNILLDKHILLIDDVLTTGATLESCSNTILKIQNTRISFATLALAEI